MYCGAVIHRRTSPLTALQRAWFWRLLPCGRLSVLWGDSVPLKLLAGDHMIHGAKNFSGSLSVSAEDEMSLQSVQMPLQRTCAVIWLDRRMLPGCGVSSASYSNGWETVPLYSKSGRFTFTLIQLPIIIIHNEENGENNGTAAE